MNPLNSHIQLALLNRKKGRNLLEKGFTLVELMIVIVIVGVLSAVALPNFLGTKDKAAAGAQIGEMAGFAKNCATNAILGDDTALSSIDNTRITLTPLGSSTACATGATLANATAFANPAQLTGMKCGNDTQDDNAEDTCTMTISADGGIQGAWS